MLTALSILFFDSLLIGAVVFLIRHPFYPRNPWFRK